MGQSLGFEQIEGKFGWIFPNLEGQNVMVAPGDEVLGIPKIFEPDILRLNLDKLSGVF